MPRILLAEDDAMNRVMIARRLTYEGFEVLSVADGLKAVAQARTEQPDLILMDIKMPHLDGWEATRQLKSALETRAIPVVVLSAYALDEDRQRGQEAGCDAYIIKPIEFDELLATIRLLLQQRTLGE